MPAKTELFVRRTPGGVFTINREDLCTGSIFFVDSVTGVDAAGYGSNPDVPLATLDYAVGLCTADKGDKIYLMPGHAEAVIAAGTVTLDIAGVTVVGLGNGSLRPTFTFGTNAGATIAVSAANVRLVNLIFDQSGIDAITTGINITAAGCEIEQCKFICSRAAKFAAKSVVMSAAAAGTNIHHCEFSSPVTTAVNCIYTAAAVDNVQITDNRFYGYWSGSPILNDTAAATNVFIGRNTFWMLHATGVPITLHANATGMIVGNHSYLTKNIAAGGSMAAAAALKSENYAAELAHVDGSSQLDPAAGAWA